MIYVLTGARMIAEQLCGFCNVQLSFPFRLFPRCALRKRSSVRPKAFPVHVEWVSAETGPATIPELGAVKTAVLTQANSQLCSFQKCDKQCMLNFGLVANRGAAPARWMAFLQFRKALYANHMSVTAPLHPAQPKRQPGGAGRRWTGALCALLRSGRGRLDGSGGWSMPLRVLT